jgi:hypothetical protein
MLYELLAQSTRTDLIHSATDRDRLLAQMLGLKRTETNRHGVAKLVRHLHTLRHHPS